MPASITLKRESLFNFLDIEKIKTRELQTINDYIIADNRLSELQKRLKQIIANKTTAFYQQDKSDELKQMLKVKNKFRKGKRIISQIDLFDNVEKKLIVEYDDLQNQLTEERGKYETIFKKSDNSFQYFFDNDRFRDALKFNNEDTYPFLIDRDKYTKFSTIQSRYNYIQRATVKTSPLSYLGTTVYNSDSDRELDKIEVNQFVKTILLKVASNDINLRDKLRYQINPLLFQEVEQRQPGYYFEKQVLYKDFDWLLKKVDTMHNKQVLELLKKIGINQSVSYMAIEKQVSMDRCIDIDMLFDSFLVNPYFAYYMDYNNFKELFVDTFSEKVISSLFITDKEAIEQGKLDAEIMKYVEENKPTNLMADISQKLNSVPLYYHNHLKTTAFSAPELSIEQKGFLFERIIKPNSYTNKLLNIVSSEFEMYQEWNLLEILTDIYENILFNKAVTRESIMFKPNQKKSAIYFYQVSSNGKLSINNVNLGTGSVVTRDIEVFDNQLVADLHKHFKNLFKNDYPIYELVLDQEISNGINVGKTNLRKICWPEDFVNVSIDFSSHNEVQFIFNGERINILYTGTIPPHLFEGTKGLLMSLINPWTVDIKKLKEYNGREEFYLKNEETASLMDKDEIQFFINITTYFHKHQLPFDFFMVAKKSGQLQHEKPIWMTLYSKYSLKILNKVISEGKDISISRVTPDRADYLIDDKCVEYAKLEIWEES